jgi:hypothetical protein
LPGPFAFFFTLTFDWDTTKLHFLTKKKRKKTMTIFSSLCSRQIAQRTKKVSQAIDEKFYIISPRLIFQNSDDSNG